MKIQSVEAIAIDIPLTKAAAVTFVSFLDAGTQALTFTQTDSTGVLPEIDLNIFNQSPDNLGSRIYAGPAVGGTWVDEYFMARLSPLPSRPE